MDDQEAIAGGDPGDGRFWRLGGCTLGQARTTAPAKPPAADYQAAVSALAARATNIRGICYNAADLAVYRARMVQMELNVATLQCQTPGGSRAYETSYARLHRASSSRS